VQGRDSHLCRAAHSLILILSRNSKVLNAWVIRWPKRLACEGKRSDYGDEWSNPKNGSLRNDRCYRPNRAVPPVKYLIECGYAAKKKENCINHRWQKVTLQGHITSDPGESRSIAIEKRMTGQMILLTGHVEQ